MAWVILEIGFRDSGVSRPRMNRTISTGTSVIARIEEKPTASVFVHAKRTKHPSFLRLQEKDGQEGNHDDHERKENGRTNLLGRVEKYPASLCFGFSLCSARFLDRALATGPLETHQDDGTCID